MVLFGEVWELQEKGPLRSKEVAEEVPEDDAPCSLPPTFMALCCQVSSASLADPLYHHCLQSQAMEAAVG